MKIKVALWNVAKESENMNAEKRILGNHPSARRNIPFVPFMTLSVSRPQEHSRNRRILLGPSRARRNEDEHAGPPSVEKGLYKVT